MPKKLLNRAHVFFTNPAHVILVVFFCVLTLLTLYPLLSLVTETLIVHPMEIQITGKSKGSFTPYHWAKLLRGGEYSLHNSTACNRCFSDFSYSFICLYNRPRS